MKKFERKSDSNKIKFECFFEKLKRNELRIIF